MSTVIVTLKPYQVLIASQVAIMRRTSNMVKNVKPKHGASNADGSWEMDILSCHAEMAAALYLNLYWDGAVNDFLARDVGGIVDVRSRTKEHYQLILHKSDPDETPFILAWTKANSSEVHLNGWIYAHEGKKNKFWADPAGGRPAYFIPKDELHPMPELLPLITA